MSTVDLLLPGQEYSDPFEIPSDKVVIINAYNLQAGESVLVERLSVTRASVAGSDCCPGPVSLPEVQAATPLRCRTNVDVTLIPAWEWVVLHDPRGAMLRLKLTSPDLELSQVVATLSVGSRDGGTDACG